MATIEFENGLVLEGPIYLDTISHELTIDTDEGPEYLSTDLSAYGLTPSSYRRVFVKNWSEHEGLATALTKTGLLRIISEINNIGPYNLTAYELEFTPQHRTDY